MAGNHWHRAFARWHHLWKSASGRSIWKSESEGKKNVTAWADWCPSESEPPVLTPTAATKNLQWGRRRGWEAEGDIILPFLSNCCPYLGAYTVLAAALKREGRKEGRMRTWTDSRGPNKIHLMLLCSHRQDCVKLSQSARTTICGGKSRVTQPAPTPAVKWCESEAMRGRSYLNFRIYCGGGNEAGSWRGRKKRLGGRVFASPSIFVLHGCVCEQHRGQEANNWMERTQAVGLYSQFSKNLQGSKGGSFWISSHSTLRLKKDFQTVHRSLYWNTCKTWDSVWIFKW